MSSPRTQQCRTRAAAERASNKALAAAVGEFSKGSLQASRIVHELRTARVDPDRVLQEIRLALQAPPDRLRGLARGIQRALERGSPDAA